MATVHKESNKRGELADLLGMSLGSGLAGMTNDYYTDKAIQGVMNDATLKNSTPEEKYSKLALALRPFGERGQKTLENLVSIEEQGTKRREGERKIAADKKKEDQENEVAKHFGVPAGTPPQVIAKLAEQDQKNKRLQDTLDFASGKKPLGGNVNTSGIGNQQPNMQNQPGEQGSFLSDKSDDDLSRMIVVPGMKDAVKLEQDRRRDIRSEAKSDRDYQLKVDERHAKFDEELNKQHANSAKERIALSQIEKSVNSGEIGPNTLTNFAQNTLKGTWLEHAFDSKESSNFQAALPQLLGGFESIFKRGLTDRDLKLVLDKLPSIGKTKEANLASVQFLRKILDLNDKKYAIAQEIKKENKGFRKIDYVDEIERRYEERYGNEINRLFADSTDSVLMTAPDGRSLTVPKADVQKMLDLKATVNNE
jgi:hypothetical protein